jgi:glycine hydroxymethyltransferase
VKDCVLLGHLIADVLENPSDEQVLQRVKESILSLTQQYPVY